MAPIAEERSVKGAAFPTGSISCASATRAPFLALVVVEAEPRANAGLGHSDGRMGVELHLLVFKASPQSLDEYVVHEAALAVSLSFSKGTVDAWAVGDLADYTNADSVLLETTARSWKRSCRDSRPFGSPEPKKRPTTGAQPE
jgi:hypothetical protein